MSILPQFWKENRSTNPSAKEKLWRNNKNAKPKKQ